MTSRQDKFSSVKFSSVESPTDRNETRTKSKKWKSAIVPVALVVVVCVPAGLGLAIGLTRPAPQRGSRVGQPCEPDSPPVGNGGPYSHAAVSTGVGRCSRIGSDILEQGGSAVDAAIASLLCVGLMNAQASGIGGGFFMTIYNKETNTAEIINARETAPAAASENMYLRNSTLSRRGGLAVAVPSEIRGYWEAHQRHGKLPWRDLFQPAIQMAKEGFCVEAEMAGAMDRAKKSIENPASHMCEVFCDNGNNVLTENTIMKRPQLAETLRAVADGGADAFYTGKIARNLVNDIQDAGGIITEQDLRDYRVEVTSPLNISLTGGLTVLSPPAPSGGPVLSLILNILDGYGLNTSSVEGVDNQILTYHRIVEAFKFAYAKRTELADPNFVEISELVRNMTSAEFAESLRLRISDNTTHDYRYYGPSFVLPDDGGTSQVSVLGPNGDAVSITSTINHGFGAMLRSPSTGVILNNEMDDFSSPNLTSGFGVPPSKPNFIRPGKRPVSSMTPTVVLDGNGDVRLVTGGSGGTVITTATANVILQHLLFGLDIGPAVEKPRLHHQLIPNILGYEKPRSIELEAVLEGLRQKNHVIMGFAFAGRVHSVAKKDDVITAAGDSRRKGAFPAGF